jgi:hypothetical protein
MSPGDLGAKLTSAWREILDAEQARGAAIGDQAAFDAAQHVYELALERFRHMQLEAFTVALGSVQLLTELIDGHEARIAALERAVGERDPFNPY